VLLWSANDLGHSYLACDPTGSSQELDPEPNLSWALPDGGLRLLHDVPRWIGVLPYEALRERLERPAFSLPDTRVSALCSRHLWYRYGAVAVVNKGEVYVAGDDERRVQSLRQILETPHIEETAQVGASEHSRLSLVVGSEADQTDELDRHRNRVKRAIELIREGDIYQVNLARRLDFEVEGDALALLRRVSRQVKSRYAAAFELGDEVAVVSTSPELLLQTDTARRILTEPIKGTRKLDALQEQELRAELEFDPKERAELSMVVDIERNDIGRVSEFGSVIAETPRVVAYDTVLHRVARVRGLARPGVSRAEVLSSLLPSGSVTGAPKIRAMEWIAALESERRGLYTGGIGYLSHNGCVKLSMAIRCLVKRRSVGHYHVGGGIVIGSDPQRELEETFWKAQQVLTPTPVDR
jgi:anthranilate/para-aminobenzoate synthase component I